MAAAYLDAFKAGDEDIAYLGERLGEMARTWGDRPVGLWHERERRFRIFHSNEIAKTLAKSVLDKTESPPERLLSEAGLETMARFVGGLGTEVFREACRSVSALAGNSAKSSQHRLLDWGGGETGQFLFPGAWVDYFSAMTRPWAGREPDPLWKNRILGHLISAAGGDPRIRENQRWLEVKARDPDAYRVVMRWLTRASVVQFLDIVGASLTDATHRTQWAYRRAFWMSYLEDGNPGPRVEEAWVAFGDEAAADARNIARRRSDRSFEQFGIQRTTSRTPRHSALIMRIGSFVVAEWSHNSKCQFWESTDRAAPKLYQPHYGDVLYMGPRSESHGSAATYSWQKKFAEIIEKRSYYHPKSSWRPAGA